MSLRLHRLALTFIVAFSLIALTGGYWVFITPEALLTRADNPRRILLERRFPRGTIYDRDDAPLAYSTGEPGELSRYYPYPSLAPVLGYISAFYGSSGIESAADSILHGDADRDPVLLWRDDLLGAYPPGRGVRLTLSLPLQTQADTLLRSRTGAIVLIDTVTGEILALASQPTYDPNTIEDDWTTLNADPGAPFLNRATLALYQPGGALQPFILAAALRAHLAELDAPYPSASAQVGVGDLTLDCLTAPTAEAVTLAQALVLRCPWPFADLGNQLGARSLDQLFHDLRFFEAPAIELPTLASPLLELNTAAPIVAIGQGPLNITPLQLALATAAIARDGQLPAPQLIRATQTPNGEWQTQAPLAHPIAALDPNTVAPVKALLREGHAALALTSAGGKTLAWFSGFAPFENSRYAVAVLLEDGDVNDATQIGQALLQAATP